MKPSYMNSLPPETVLASIDFTETSLNALAVAIAFCHQQQSGLHLLYVLPPDEVDSSFADQSGSKLSDNHLIREGNSMIQMLAQVTAQEQKIVCSSSCRSGLAHEETIATARSLNAKLIVMGTHTGSDLLAYRTNNEAYQVIKTAPCPVLTVPDNYNRTTFNHILFPVRPIPHAASKYKFARKIIRQNGAELTILALAAPDKVVSMDQLQDALSQLGANLAQDGVRSQTLFCPTDAMAETVLEKAGELQPDLLIITAQLATTSDNFFIGPFTQQIIHNARIPVLSVHPESLRESNGRLYSGQHNQTDSDLDLFDL